MLSFLIRAKPGLTRLDIAKVLGRLRSVPVPLSKAMLHYITNANLDSPIIQRAEITAFELYIALKGVDCRRVGLLDLKLIVCRVVM